MRGKRRSAWLTCAAAAPDMGGELHVRVNIPGSTGPLRRTSPGCRLSPEVGATPATTSACRSAR